MSKKMIVLKTSDGESFEIDDATALQSQTIAQMIEDDCADNAIPLTNITSNILAKVIEYCKKHVNVSDSSSDEAKADLKKWDAEFVKIDKSTIFDIMLAANYLNIASLLDLTCQKIADMIAACKTAQEIREKFEIENDFTPEEEEEIRRDNQWAFE